MLHSYTIIAYDQYFDRTQQIDFPQPQPQPQPHTLTAAQSFEVFFILPTFMCLMAYFFASAAYWLVHGTKQSNQQQLPPVIFKKYETTHKFNDCAICLEDFEEGDTCGVLPSCDHSFHPKCIRRWLVKNQNQTCPLCRCPVACSCFWLIVNDFYLTLSLGH
ncbi:putative E3 ubiquitin-protein ligase ATL44 [Camellia lanceoleosa]|uniref:E3 ubiquitin-protein ligase ATL44 n=1 Tax=Camellia lanceoleosa TaxID=1840588 RepID=A0ACC0H0H3_9ERIC|nr:putative E3 ubiquitin-protein ligase ATL44 [Camellia lanceoleosa]